MPTLKSVIIRPSAPRDPKDPLIIVVPSLLKKVLNIFSISPSLNFLRNLTLLDINNDTSMPSYINDPHLLVHLAFILCPQLGDHALEKIAMDYMDIEENEAIENEVVAEIEIVVVDVDETKGDADVEVLESPPPIFMTPRRKKKLKVKERLDDSFLRRSRRISSKLQGYKNAESA